MCVILFGAPIGVCYRLLLGLPDGPELCPVSCFFIVIFAHRGALDTQTIVLNLAAVLIGISKAGFGGGTGIVVAPMLALILPAKQTVGLMLPLLLATDILSLLYYWNRWDRRNVLALMPGALLGILAGTQVLYVIPDLYLKKTIGLLACIFALIQAVRDVVLKSKSPFTGGGVQGVVAGFVTGVISTLAHIGGLVTTMYLLPQRLSNRTFVGTTTAVYFLINAAKMGPYVGLGLVNGPVLMRDLFLLPSIAAGTGLGILLNRRVSSGAFSKVLLLFVLITGIMLLAE